MLWRNFPTPPLPAVPAALLAAFTAEQKINHNELSTIDTLETQLAFAAYTGARMRATQCGGLKGHAEQAAAILVLIDEIGDLLAGGFTVGGREGLLDKLDDDEMEPIRLARRTLETMLEWHMENGGGALLPIADHLGIVHKVAA